MNGLRAVTLVLALFALIPSARIVADEGDRWCECCQVDDNLYYAAGWYENSNGNPNYSGNEYEGATSIAANGNCTTQWCGGECSEPMT